MHRLWQWLVTLSARGDPKLGIQRQLQLSPVYAFNTIITMCQRASAADEAKAAYARICTHSLQPDVFTLTALIDCVGRAHDVAAASWLFGRMGVHGIAPNAVTLVTVARTAVAHECDALFLSALTALRGATVGMSADSGTAESPSLATGAAGSAGGEGEESGEHGQPSRTASIVLASSLECCLRAQRLDLAETVLLKGDARALNLRPTLITASSPCGAKCVFPFSRPPARGHPHTHPRATTHGLVHRPQLEISS